MSSKTSGSIKMNDGSIFVWMTGGGDGEIFGHIQKQHGGIKKGTSGWYRTNSPQVAAMIAEKNIV